MGQGTIHQRARVLELASALELSFERQSLDDLVSCLLSDFPVSSESAPSTNLKPVRGAVVKVRFEEDEEITWLQGKLTDLNKETGEWSIKLDSCDGAQESQGECNGCQECVWELAPDDRSW